MTAWEREGDFLRRLGQEHPQVLRELRDRCMECLQPQNRPSLMVMWFEMFLERGMGADDVTALLSHLVLVCREAPA